MTPEEFKIEMEQLKIDGDPEAAHGNMDVAICKLLVSLGYADGVKIFMDQEKWYS